MSEEDERCKRCRIVMLRYGVPPFYCHKDMDLAFIQRCFEEAQKEAADGDLDREHGRA